MADELAKSAEVGKEGENQNEETKTYTKEEVDKLLQAESDRRVSQALAKQKEKVEQARREAEKLATMSADEKYRYELDQREKAIADKERQLTLMENKNEASKILAEKGLSLDLVDFIVADDAETMDANIKKLDKAFKASVKAEVEKRLAGSTPKKGLPATDELTREKFKKMGLAERAQLKDENPELYNSLRG